MEIRIKGRLGNFEKDSPDIELFDTDINHGDKINISTTTESLEHAVGCIIRDLSLNISDVLKYYYIEILNDEEMKRQEDLQASDLTETEE